MKKISILIFAVFSCLLCSAQNEIEVGGRSKKNNGLSANKLVLALEGAGSITTFSDKNEFFNKENTVGFKFGVTGLYRIAPRVEMGLGINLAQYRHSFYSNLSQTRFDQIDQNNYINVKPYIHIVSKSTNSIKPFVSIGLFGGYLVKSKYKSTNSVTLESTSYDATEFYNRINAGVEGGVGLKINLTSNKTVYIKATYELGLTTITRKEDLLPQANNNFLPLKTNALNLYLIYPIFSL
ncbi:porin family protein [Siphonobacter sp.]|uniref:porin family protein n=1 Tax=Siphonobacter sp. TaxID=1869184 RepID=UPI003B3BE7AA